jgi:hypothetical protein
VTGPIGGGSLPLGEEIARALGSGLKDVAIVTVHSAGAVSNIHAIQHGHAEMALTFASPCFRLRPSCSSSGLAWMFGDRRTCAVDASVWGRREAAPQ